MRPNRRLRHIIVGSTFSLATLNNGPVEDGGPCDNWCTYSSGTSNKNAMDIKGAWRAKEWREMEKVQEQPELHSFKFYCPAILSLTDCVFYRSGDSLECRAFSVCLINSYICNWIALGSHARYFHSIFLFFWYVRYRVCSKWCDSRHCCDRPNWLCYNRTMYRALHALLLWRCMDWSDFGSSGFLFYPPSTNWSTAYQTNEHIAFCSSICNASTLNALNVIKMWRRLRAPSNRQIYSNNHKNMDISRI